MLGSHLFLTKTCTRAIADELTAFFVVVDGVAVAVSGEVILTRKLVAVARCGFPIVVGVEAVVGCKFAASEACADTTRLATVSVVVTCDKPRWVVRTNALL